MFVGGSAISLFVILIFFQLLIQYKLNAWTISVRSIKYILPAMFIILFMSIVNLVFTFSVHEDNFIPLWLFVIKIVLFNGALSAYITKESDSTIPILTNILKNVLNVFCRNSNSVYPVNE